MGRHVTCSVQRLDRINECSCDESFMDQDQFKGRCDHVFVIYYESRWSILLLKHPDVSPSMGTTAHFNRHPLMSCTRHNFV